MTYYNVGKIVNAQGLQGELRVLSVTDFADESRRGRRAGTSR